MLDASKYADLVLLLIDGSFGFEMETFEFLNLLQVPVGFEGSGSRVLVPQPAAGAPKTRSAAPPKPGPRPRLLAGSPFWFASAAPALKAVPCPGSRTLSPGPKT